MLCRPEIVGERDDDLRLAVEGEPQRGGTGPADMSIPSDSKQ